MTLLKTPSLKAEHATPLFPAKAGGSPCVQGQPGLRGTLYGICFLDKVSLRSLGCCVGLTALHPRAPGQQECASLPSPDLTS